MVNTTKRIQNNPKRSLTVRQVKANLKTSFTVRHTMRRSVTIEPQLHDFIIELRGWFAMEKKLDLDYTTVLNILAKVGADVFGDISKLTEKQRELVMESINATPEEQAGIKLELGQNKIESLIKLAVKK